MKILTDADVEGPRPDQATRVLVQRFAASFEYPVVFTHAVFSPGNPALAETLGRREPDRLHRVFVVIDDGVARAWPDLAGEIELMRRPTPRGWAARRPSSSPGARPPADPTVARLRPPRPRPHRTPSC
jgi:hypothetical protein